ncbi:MAG: SDR family NAD(P)-dependent oxidoreductase, partial [Patescibacteria group bacterium]
FETNVFGTLRTTQIFADAMLKRKKGGRIITVSSVAVRLVIPFLGPYHMSKFALEAGFDAFRMELEPEGIWISLIEPGLIYTGFNERMADTKYEWLSAESLYKKNIPAMRHHDSTLTLRSHGTDSVVKAMIHAVESNKPKTRYVRPRSYKRVLLALSFLPTRLRDKILRRSLGL